NVTIRVIDIDTENGGAVMTETFKGIIIAVNTPERKNIESEVNELVNLAESIGIDITGVHVQNRATMDPRSYAGSGFLNEIDLQYEKGSLDYVIVNDEITASQNRAVEEVMDT